MKKKFEHKESRGLPGGPNEMFTYVTGVFDIYQAPSNIEGQGMFAGKPFKKGDFIGLAHSNGQPASQLGRMHNHNENSPSMISKKSGNDRFVFAAKDLQPGDELTTNYRMQPELEQPEDFQFGGSITAPPRKGVRKNPDGSESTHLMATETLDGKNWFSFPTLFQDPDGTWIDMSDRPWEEAYEEAKRRGEVIEFGTDKEAAIKFGEGSWKLPKAQEGNGEVPLNRSEIFNIPRTMGYENGEMVLQDKPIWDGMLDEVTITPYTQSKLYGEYMMANKATGGLEPVYPIFDIMTLGLKAPATAGAKAIQAGIKKAPSKINPKYYNPNTLAKGDPSVYYRKAGKDAYEDFVNSGFVRTRAEVTDQPIMGLLDTKKEMDQVRKSIKEYGQFKYRHPSDFRAPYFSRGRTADMISGGDDYLFQTRPGLIGDDAFTSGQMNILHGRGKSQVVPGGYGIMDPMQRSADNFDVFKKSWWHGYKPIKAYGGSLPKAQDGNGETHTVASGETFFGIANKYKLDKQDLIDANPGLNIESIKAGQTINLPIIEKMEPIAISAADSKREPTSWMDYVNPYNWGVTDRDDDGTFNQAFRAARNAGEDEFMWYGTRYNTNLKPTPDKLEVEEVSNEVEKVKETGPFNDYTVTPELLYKQAFVESTLDPKVENAGGYKGLGQIGDKLITDYKKANKVDFVDPFDAKQNHDVQEWSMNELYNSSFIDKPGSTNEVKLIKALASYNWGRGYVRNLLEKQKAKGVDIYTDTAWTSELPKETRDYINMILYDGVTEKRPLVQENFKNALVDDTYKDIRNLYIYKSGGEKNEFQIYKDYIEGVYDGTEMEKPAEKIYDKLNRVYYKEAKKQGMRVPNYIMTNVIKQIDN